MHTILFDLDGTLLPMDQEEFTKTYLTELSKKGALLGYEPKTLVQTVLGGLEVMVANDGNTTNEKRFWEFFLTEFGGDQVYHSKKFDEFYLNEFAKVAEATQPTPLARKYVDLLKAKGYNLVLATNPIFPKAATYARLDWAGLKPEDFLLVTTYENSRFAKPNLAYYQEILTKIGVEPKDCIMIGNDVEEDLCVAELGMAVYLVTDDLINPKEKDISNWPQGTREELLAYLTALPQVNAE